MLKLGYNDRNSWNKNWGFIAVISIESPVYRVYNSASSDHLFTTNRAERDDLVNAGWSDEGVAAVIHRMSADGRLPLGRLFNPAGTSHIAIAGDTAKSDLMAADPNWLDEGILGWVDTSGGVPLYLLVLENSNRGIEDAVLTTNPDERSNLLAAGWKELAGQGCAIR